TVVITQNADDLHERAGSREPVHLHGSLFAPRCIGAAPHPASVGEPADDDANDRGPTGSRALGRPGGGAPVSV
ncbi:Sir2 family NAD-dependent protein deacetylase, partial [Streptomyces cuspidosporus]|uniref:Sir2 family NAD-dependent protein deacetylase n=1 Tax=Streptomyces cuspidosporus TaxID=66882 RepID=UPI0031FDDB94